MDCYLMPTCFVLLGTRCIKAPERRTHHCHEVETSSWTRSHPRHAKRGGKPAGPRPGRPDPRPGHPVPGPADRAARRIRPGQNRSPGRCHPGAVQGPRKPVRSPSGAQPGLDRVGWPRARLDRPPDRIPRVCLDQIFLGRLFLYLFDLSRPVNLYKCPGRPHLFFRHRFGKN